MRPMEGQKNIASNRELRLFKGDRGNNILSVIVVVVLVEVCVNASKQFAIVRNRRIFSGDFGSPGLDLNSSHVVPVMLYVVVTVEVIVLI